jgi:hypothetical protein
MTYTKRFEVIRHPYDTEAYGFTNSTTLQTLVDLTGRGRMQISIVHGEDYANSSDIQVTVDSNVVCTDRALVYTDTTNSAYTITLRYEWESNFKFEYASSSGSYTIEVTGCYWNE